MMKATHGLSKQIEMVKLITTIESITTSSGSACSMKVSTLMKASWSKEISATNFLKKNSSSLDLRTMKQTISSLTGVQGWNIANMFWSISKAKTMIEGLLWKLNQSQIVSYVFLWHSNCLMNLYQSQFKTSKSSKLKIGKVSLF